MSPNDQEVLAQAKASVAKAKSVEELRQAQAVLLPLELGLTLEQTAVAIGVSTGWACRLRTKFILNSGKFKEVNAIRGGRRRENMTPEEEAAFLRPFFEKATTTGEKLVVGDIKQVLERRLGRKVALASVYNLLHRNGWSKPVSGKQEKLTSLLAVETQKN